MPYADEIAHFHESHEQTAAATAAASTAKGDEKAPVQRSIRGYGHANSCYCGQAAQTERIAWQELLNGRYDHSYGPRWWKSSEKTDSEHTTNKIELAQWSRKSSYRRLRAPKWKITVKKGPRGRGRAWCDAWTRSWESKVNGGENERNASGRIFALADQFLAQIRTTLRFLTCDQLPLF